MSIRIYILVCLICCIDFCNDSSAAQFQFKISSVGNWSEDISGDKNQIEYKSPSRVSFRFGIDYLFNIKRDFSFSLGMEVGVKPIVRDYVIKSDQFPQYTFGKDDKVRETERDLILVRFPLLLEKEVSFSSENILIYSAGICGGINLPSDLSISESKVINGVEVQTLKVEYNYRTRSYLYGSYILQLKYLHKTKHSNFIGCSLSFNYDPRAIGNALVVAFPDDPQLVNRLNHPISNTNFSLTFLYVLHR